MTPERWSRVAALFSAVSDAPEDERAELLDRLCGPEGSDDRRAVERLLRADRAADRVVDRVRPLAAGLHCPDPGSGGLSEAVKIYTIGEAAGRQLTWGSTACCVRSAVGPRAWSTWG